MALHNEMKYIDADSALCSPMASYNPVAVIRKNIYSAPFQTFEHAEL